MSGEVTGNDLYRQTIAFEYPSADIAALMKRVWSVTPFMVECFTDSVNSERYCDIMRWCGDTFGKEAWPIHNKLGQWQRGGATVNGFTTMGFASAEQLEAFNTRWPNIPQDKKP